MAKSLMKAVLVSAGLAIAFPAMAEVDVGPLTPYGEMPKEAAAKRLVFEWIDQAIVQGKPDEAFKRYISPDFREHSHLLPKGRGYDVALKKMRSLAAAKRKGVKLPLPKMASVNGPMVTVYGESLDVYRVVDGKITDHWDITPAKAITIPAHAPGTAERVMSGAGRPVDPPADDSSLKGAPGTERLARVVNTGPTPPQGEAALERANKRVIFEQSEVSWVQGNFPAAFERYVSKDFRNYSHLLTHGKREYAGYNDTISNVGSARNRMVKGGEKPQVPTLATANGAIVAMFGEGVDLDEVIDGKNTAHYDASPPAEAVLRPHRKGGFFLP